MKYGARNQIVGEVTRIKSERDGIMSQVQVAIPAEAVMESVMTSDSLEELGLQVGDKVRVVVKAIHVLLVRE